MPEIIIPKELMDGGSGSRFLMAEIASVMLFPNIKSPEKRKKLEYALLTQLHLNFYRKHQDSEIGASIFIPMLEHAALADMSLINSGTAKKNLSIGGYMGLLLKRMFREARQQKTPVAFWSDETIEIAGQIAEYASEKTLERNMTLFKPVLHFWAASVRLAHERHKVGLKYERIPCDISELEKFIQYSEMYYDAGINYKQPQNHHTIISVKTAWQVVLKDFELPVLRIE